LDYRLQTNITEGVGTNRLYMRLKNNVGNPITIPNVGTASNGGISASSESTTEYYCDVLLIDVNNPPPGGPLFWFGAGDIGIDYTWKTGNIIDVELRRCNSNAAGIKKGNKEKVLITINYYSAGSGNTYARQVKGEVFTTAQ